MKIVDSASDLPYSTKISNTGHCMKSTQLERLTTIRYTNRQYRAFYEGNKNGNLTTIQDESADARRSMKATQMVNLTTIQDKKSRYKKSYEGDINELTTIQYKFHMKIPHRIVD